jgi:hypothetical protein
MFWHNHAIIGEQTLSLKPLTAKMDYNFTTISYDSSEIHRYRYKIAMHSPQMALGMLKHVSVKGLLHHVLSVQLVCVGTE